MYRVDLFDVVDAVIIDIETVNNNNNNNENDDDEKPQAVLELLHKSDNHYSTGQVRLITFKDGKIGRKQRTVMHIVEKKKSILVINLGANFSYRMIIRRADIIERIACLVRDRWPILYPIIIGLCLITVATRIDNNCYKTTTVTCVITLILALYLDCLFETFVAIGFLHVFAVTTCCLVVFFGSVAHNVVARFFARIAALPILWFDWLLGGLDNLPIITTFILLSLMSVTCGAVAILLSVGLLFLKLTKIYDECMEELLMTSLRQFIPFVRKRKVDDSQQDASSSVKTTKTRRQSIFDCLLVFVISSLTAIPAIPSALVWAKNFRYETRLTTEEPAMLLSWMILASWTSLGFIDLPASTDGYSSRRLLLIGTIIRISGWVLLYTARLKNSPHYQWIVPPLVALCVTLVALLSLFPGKKKLN